jgi:hypothetical protein
MELAVSVNGVQIRLTEERWFHIAEEHSEMAGYYFEVLETIQEPTAVYKGNADELLAVKEIEVGKYIIVVYKEINNKDGFIITSFLTKRIKQIEKRTKIWPR